MKSFAKLSLLLALVVAGRFLRPASPTASATAITTKSLAAEPDALRLTFFSGTQAPEAVPVSRRTTPSKTQPDAEPSVWF